MKKILPKLEFLLKRAKRREARKLRKICRLPTFKLLQILAENPPSPNPYMVRPQSPEVIEVRKELSKRQKLEDHQNCSDRGRHE
jgi:hypothetical protein